MSLRRFHRAGPFLVLAVALLLLAPVSLAVAGLTGTPEAAPSAEFVPNFDPYIYRMNGSAADPINLIFRVGDAERVAEAVQRVLGWRPVAGSPMLFRDRGQERPTVRHFGLVLGGGVRLHMRIEAITAADGQDYVLAAVHRDASVPCGHTGGAFDETRDLVAGAFAAAGYKVTRVRLGNTAAGRHCDGSTTGGDGAAAMIALDGS